MSRPPVALRLALIILTVALALLAPGEARAQPVASFTFSPALPLTGELVSFVSTSTGAIEPQRWDLDGDGACDDATGPSVQRSFPTAGTYSVKLCVTDGVDEATSTRKINALNRPPVAAFTYAPLAPLTGDQVIVTSTSSDLDGPLTSLAWDLDNDGAFDDGGGPTMSLSFTSAGAYTVKLLAVDRDGAASVALQTIAVGKRPPRLLGPFPIVRMIARVTRRGTRVQELTVEAPPGSEVTIRCRGRGCPVRKLTRTLRGARPVGVVRIRRFRRRSLRPGARMRIWVTQPERIGKYTRFRIRRGKRPARVDRCVMPGTTRPSVCPAS